MKVMGGWKLFVVALVVVIVALALVMPLAGGIVARSGGDGSVAADCQSGTACGGSIIAVVTPTPEPPPGPNADCQSGHSCGG